MSTQPVPNFNDAVRASGPPSAATPTPCAAVPNELKALRQWVLWKLEERDGRMTKVPYQTDGRRADPTGPKTWNTFDVCVKALETGRFSGIGFVFAKGAAAYGGVDLDKCRDPQTGVTEPWAAQIIKELGSYTELSQSKTGWHILVKNCELPVDGGRNKRVEMYCNGRYFCMTGERAASCTEIRGVSLASLYQRMVEDKLDPRPAKDIHGRPINGRDTSPSGEDYKIIASLARELRTEDPAVIESEIARRYPERYQGQNEKHGERKGDTYWHYSIVRFVERQRQQAGTESSYTREARQKHTAETYVESGISPTEPSPQIEIRSQDAKVHPVEERLDMPRAVLSGRLGEICEKNMLDDFPVAYAWLSLVTAASVLVPERPANRTGGDNLHNLYTALVGPVNCGKSQAIEWAMNLLRIQDDPRQYSEVKPGSAERLLKYMNHLYAKDKLGPRVLMFLDEWKFFFDKAGIESSVFPTLLTTGFYRKNTTILDSHGKPLMVPASFSWIGGIVTDSYDDCLSHVTSLGLHDRLLQGINPSNYTGFNYRPFDGEVLPEDFTLRSVQIDRTVWECLKEWKGTNPQGTREAEIAFRVAEICAGFDGAPTLYGKDLGPHLILAAEQMKIRKTLKPNIGETPDAQCAIKVENYLKTHGPAGEWLDFRVMMKDIHYERFGPNAFKRTIDGLTYLKIVETDQRSAGAGNLPGGRPAKVIRLVLE